MRTSISGGPAHQAGADSSPAGEVPARTERTLSSGRLCANCVASLAGRRPQARFCSDRCRSEHRRQLRTTRLQSLVASLEKTVTALKDAIGARDE